MAKTTPLTPVLAAEGAHFTVVNGWERAEFFAPTPEFQVTPSFRFDESFAVVAAEVQALHQSAGLTEVNGFNRFEITGVDAQSFLDRMICGRLPGKAGRVGLAYLLNQQGALKSECTIANLPASDRGPARIWYGSAAASEYHDMDWLMSNLRADEDVHIRSLTNDQTILVLAGPKARDILQAVSRLDWSAAAFPWLSVRECFVGIAPATVMAVSFSGELAYEIHVPNAQLFAAYTALRAAGADYDMTLFGAHAVESMRMEKGYLHWKADLLTEFDPFETGLDRFVDMQKPDFVGKTALTARQSKPTTKRMTLEVLSEIGPAHGGASIMLDGRVVGSVTSGAYGHRVGKNIAYAFVNTDIGPQDDLFLDLLGALVQVKLTMPCLFDPEMTRVRS